MFLVVDHTNKTVHGYHNLDEAMHVWCGTIGSFVDLIDARAMTMIDRYGSQWVTLQDDYIDAVKKQLNSWGQAV